ncbi:MAG: hypothetical protein QOH99_1638, partial [Frankiaceae bacterium]|nr:hypothetical protein [Frankiaceae bacterium]
MDAVLQVDDVSVVRDGSTLLAG